MKQDFEFNQQILNYVENDLKHVEGWCCSEKALKLYQIIIENDLNSCLEIGVFGGSSFIPQALAMKHKKNGVVYGIDPWNSKCSVEDMEHEANKNWWGKLNHEYIYNSFIKHLENYGIKEYSKIFINKSSDVVDKFAEETIDLLHIDGNHCERLAYEDAINYLPKIKLEGFIFFDDSTWVEYGENPSTGKALSYLLDYCENIMTVGKDCVILKKIKNTN
jgi:predicted O-methyltransferase YrrM